MKSRFINPTWFAKYSHGVTTVLSDGTINLNGEILTFKDKLLPPDTEVKVWLDKFFCCASIQDIEEHKRQYQLSQETKKQLHNNTLNKHRDEAISFNATIQLPIKWDVGIKHVLSGLSETSQGNGINRATVNHIILLENFESGRLKRSKGSFLCSTAPNKDGMQYIDYAIGKDSTVSFERHVDGEGKEYQPKITCKACLQVLELLKKQSQKPIGRKR